MEAQNVFEIYEMGNVFRTSSWMVILPHTDIRTCLERAFRAANTYASAKSRKEDMFSLLVPDWDEFVALTEKSNFIDLVPGKDRQVFMVFRNDDYIGSFLRNLAFDDKKYRVKMIDGCLKAVGPVDRVEEMTRFFSASFVPVETGDGYGTEEYALAGVFPGRPDVGKQCLEGLKEGDRIYGSEVNVRRLPLMEPETTNESLRSEKNSVRIVPPSFETAPKDSEPSVFCETDVHAYLDYAYVVANKYKTDFLNPLAGYISDDFRGWGARENKSLFYKVGDWEEFATLTEQSVVLEIVPGINRQLFMVFSSTLIVGYHVLTRAFDDKKYEVKMIDGRLKAIGPVDIVKEDTGLFTVAFAPVVKKEDDYGDEEFGHFRAFPGRPEIHPFTDGLKEGDVISGSEVNARRLQPIAPDSEQESWHYSNPVVRSNPPRK
jgi:hypothetical protein